MDSALVIRRDMEGRRVYWRQAIHSENLGELLNTISEAIQFPRSTGSFAEKLLNEEEKHKLIGDITLLSKEVVLHKKIKTETDSVEPGKVYVFEVDVCWEGNKIGITEQEPDEWHKFLLANENDEVRVILIQSKCMPIIEAKLEVYKRFKSHIDSENIFLLHKFEEYDEVAKLSAHKKISCFCDVLQDLSRSIPYDNLRGILDTAAAKSLTGDKIRSICYSVYLFDDTKAVGTVNSDAYLCFSVFRIKRLKGALVQESLNRIGNSLGSEICNGILHHIESNVKSRLVNDLADLKIELSENLYYSVKDIVITAIFWIFSPWVGLIVTAGMIFVNLVWPENINSESWRRKVANEIHDKIQENRSAILNRIRPDIENNCINTSADLQTVVKNLIALQQKIHLVDQQKLIAQWKKREIMQFKDKVSLTDCPSFLQCIAGYSGDGNEVMKVFLRGEKPENIKKAEATEEKFRSWFKVPDNYIFELVYVDTKFNEIKRKNHEKNLKEREESLVIDMPTYVRLGNIIKNKSEKMYACFTNVISIGISKVRCVGDEIRAETCITLYCLDKHLIPFGEKALPESLEGWPCDVREDIVMFGATCPQNCPAMDRYLPEPGCSIGIKEKDSSGSVGFLVESNHGKSFFNGFLTASHVAVEQFEEYYNKSFLSQHVYPFCENYIVHPSYQDNARECQKVGTVVDSFFGEYNSASIDVALIETKKRRTKDSVKLPVFNDDQRILDEKLTVTKTGRTTGETTGVLKNSIHSVKVNQQFSSRRFFSFCNCYVVENLNEETFFSQGDSGAGVFVKDNDTKRPLGIAIASLRSLTVVSKIDEFTEKLDISIVSENTDLQVDRLYSRLGNISLHEGLEQMECA